MNRIGKIATRGLIGACLIVVSAIAGAQSYPSKSVRWIVPWPAGGGTDFLTRAYAQKAAAAFGQSVLVDNPPGASGIIGADLAAKAGPDGYTVLTGDGTTLVVNAAVYRKLPYDPLKDFVPVSLLAKGGLILTVHPSAPVNSVKELIALAHSQPGKINYASVGTGTPHHLAMELFKQRTGTNMVHVPYKGSAPAMQDLLSGQIPVMFVDLATGLGHIKAGKLRAIAASTALRSPGLPEVPTLQELGIPDFDVYAWQALMVPAGTPREIVARLNQEIVTAARSPEMNSRFLGVGLEAISSTPGQAAEHMRAETAKLHPLIKSLGIIVD